MVTMEKRTVPGGRLCIFRGIKTAFGGTVRRVPEFSGSQPGSRANEALGNRGIRPSAAGHRSEVLFVSAFAPGFPPGNSRISARFFRVPSVLIRPEYGPDRRNGEVLSAEFEIHDFRVRREERTDQKTRFCRRRKPAAVKKDRIRPFHGNGKRFENEMIVAFYCKEKVRAKTRVYETKIRKEE